MAPQPPERVTLKDGREVDIRPIEPTDAETLEEGLEELSDESRYRRFLSPKRGFSRSELEYLTTVDHRAHEALVAHEPGTDHGLGVARFVKDPLKPDRAEVAIVVVDDWQGRGLGGALLHRLTDRAHEEGVRRFTASVLESNHDVVALLRTVGPVEARHPGGGVADLEIEIPDDEPCPPVVLEVLRAAARGALSLV